MIQLLVGLYILLIIVAILWYKKVRYRATHDMLTGLLNREAFEKEVRKILDKADEPYYIVCSNIKDFKLINELCGRDVGDSLLIAEENLILSGKYVNPVSTRVYADKFCTLVPKNAYKGEQFRKDMTAYIEDMISTPLKPYIYLGVYEIVDVTEPVWVMCDKARLAIDSIRGSYGQYYSVYTEEMFQRVVEEKEIIGEFEKALTERQFQMYLQPQVVNGETVIGAEALVRWLHPKKGMMSPAVFIPILERTGLWAAFAGL